MGIIVIDLGAKADQVLTKPDVIAVRIRKREDDVEGELEENDRENEEQRRREEKGGREEAIRCGGAIHFRKSAA